MSENNSKKFFFLISFLPAIAYWYLEENYPIRIAVCGGVILAIIEISLEKYFAKHVHSISKFNFIILMILGGLSLLGDEGIWFKLQPCLTGIIMGGILIFKLSTGKGMMEEMMVSLTEGKKRPPPSIIRTLEFHVSIFFLLYGSFMGWVAVYWNTDRWLFFKTGGFYLCFVVFFIFELILTRIRMKKIILDSVKSK